MSNLLVVILAVVAAVVVFLLLRAVVLWYFKIQIIADELEAQTRILKQIRDRLPDLP